MSYKDKQRGDVDWHHVKEAPNTQFSASYEVEDVKKQWRNLRDSFQKRLKGQKEPRTGSGAGDLPTKWIFFDRMQFLLEFNDEEAPWSSVDRYDTASSTVSTCSRSESNSPAPTCFGVRGNTQGRKAFARKIDPGKSAVLSRICDQLEDTNQQNGDHFDVFGAYVATMLRRIAYRDEELADIAQTELTSQLNQKFLDSVKKQPT